MNKKMKTGAAALALTAALSSGYVYANGNTDAPVSVSTTAAGKVSITVNGHAIDAGFILPDAEHPMIPVRALAEALGMELTWVKDSKTAELTKGNVWTAIPTGKDQYNVNRMYVELGQVPVIVEGTQYVPLNFASEVLHANVKTEGGSVTITTEEVQEFATSVGVVTYADDSRVHINGVGPESLILNAIDDTEYLLADGTSLDITDLKVGDQVEAQHSIVMALSMPPQSAVYKITVTEQAQENLHSVEGTIGDIRVTDNGDRSLLIQSGMLAANPQSEIVLQINEDTQVVNTKGEKVDPASITNEDYVIGFHNGVLTRSLPPIGNAIKIVVDSVDVSQSPEESAEAPAEAEDSTETIKPFPAE
ncbi:copper amine oxidase N-terminal domain-containing protein [Paenibacillus sp. PDC88]|uniref:copper amine oxidase N-terminal domain-containing protein n=1 Tax=Paenibacillus sp. PDC88 TaxID=1884375 RepID=UPI00089BDD01|nr:copper amine oxidase N-terminal domain-containing protein [Paenibacillus sp. PDC88]SDX20720.1 Copper amine oxidase N-terminal domain-containing protein [Paenibacillus sp. PDC88]